MAEVKCVFCGSKKTKLETPYLDIHGSKQYTYCCNAQKKNQEYAEKHFSPWSSEQMTAEDASKW